MICLKSKKLPNYDPLKSDIKIYCNRLSIAVTFGHVKVDMKEEKLSQGNRTLTKLPFSTETLFKNQKLTHSLFRNYSINF